MTVNKKTGTVYAATALTRGVYRISRDGVITFMKGTSEYQYIASLAIDANGVVYAGDSDATIYKSDGVDYFRLFQQIPNAFDINSLAIGKENEIYAGSSNILYKIKDGKIDNVRLAQQIKSLLINDKYDLCVAVNTNKVYKKVKNEFSFYELSGISLGDDIYTLASGPDDSLYATSFQGILYKARNFN